jgi:hypothetical protein
MANVWIYILIDPRDGCPFYVGSSIRPDQRLYEHVLYDYRSHKNTWTSKKSYKIEDIENNNHEVCMKLIKRCEADARDYWEAYFYRRYTKKGYQLLQRPLRIPIRKPITT